MDRGEGSGVWLSWDTVIQGLVSLLELVGSLFRPMTSLIMDVSNSSWLGMCVVFSIFFSVYLIRAGARSGRANRDTFSQTLEYYSGWGLVASTAFCVLLTIEWLFLPVVTVVFSTLVNSVTGSEPGLFEFLVFLLTPSLERSAFVADMMRFYGEANTVMPLGFRFASVIVVAFATMRIVSRGMAKLQT